MIEPGGIYQPGWVTGQRWAHLITLDGWIVLMINKTVPPKPQAFQQWLSLASLSEDWMKSAAMGCCYCRVQGVAL